MTGARLRWARTAEHRAEARHGGRLYTVRRHLLIPGALNAEPGQFFTLTIEPGEAGRRSEYAGSFASAAAARDRAIEEAGRRPAVNGDTAPQSVGGIGDRAHGTGGTGV